MILTVLVPLLAQVGPGTALPQAPVEIHHRQQQSAPEPSRLARCLAQTKSDPAAAIDLALIWRASEAGALRAEAEQCLGVAQSRTGRWSEAEESFIAARDDTPVSERSLRAMRGAMAGNAALAADRAAAALALLDVARSDALDAADPAQAGEIAIDRARALVALERPAEAAAALAEARDRSPGNPQAWLLSATLARREGNLAEAQSQIQRAAEINPRDPEIGLEAGVIAVLSGRDAAARQSWQSVIAAAPGSEAAKVAQGYLDQLGPADAPLPR